MAHTRVSIFNLDSISVADTLLVTLILNSDFLQTTLFFQPKKPIIVKIFKAIH